MARLPGRRRKRSGLNTSATQPIPFSTWKPHAVGGRDARRLLPAVLERIETQIGHVRGLGMVPDPEQPALVVELVAQAMWRSKPFLHAAPRARDRVHDRLPPSVTTRRSPPVSPIHRHGNGPSAHQRLEVGRPARLDRHQRPGTGPRRRAPDRAVPDRPAPPAPHGGWAGDAASASATARPPSAQSWPCAGQAAPMAARAAAWTRALQPEIERRQVPADDAVSTSRGTRCRRGSPRRGPSSAIRRPAPREPLRRVARRLVQEPDHADDRGGQDRPGREVSL